MVEIVVRRTINPKYFNEIFELYKEVVRESRKEPGNIRYDLFQDKNDPNTLLIIEEWESEDNQTYHESTKHYKKLKEKLLINTQQSCDIRFLKKINV